MDFRIPLSVLMAGIATLVAANDRLDQTHIATYTQSHNEVQQEQLIRPDLPVKGDQFGFSVAAAGNRLLAGSPYSDNPESMSGSAYLFQFTGNLWNEMAKLTASDGDFRDQFGYSVALASDYAAVGARLDDRDRGAVYIFRESAGSWHEDEKLVASDHFSGSQFGFSLSVNGNRLIVGAPRHSYMFSRTGQAYIYDFDGVTWQESDILVASDFEYNDQFGHSVALQGDIAVIGTVNKDTSGAVYVFRYNGQFWTQEAKLRAEDGATGDSFGQSISIDNNVIAIGAANVGDIHDEAGAAYIFRYNGSSWQQEAKIYPPDSQANAHFGHSVSLQADRLLISAYKHDVPETAGFNHGVAHLYQFDGQVWNLEKSFMASNAANGDAFGQSVSLTQERALIGAHVADDPDQSSQGINMGAVYSYALPKPAQPVGETCKAIKQAVPDAISGFYYLDPDGEGSIQPFEAYCDMLTHGGGWTLYALHEDGLSQIVTRSPLSLTEPGVLEGWQWRALIDTMTEGMMFVDESGRVTSISAARLNQGRCSKPSLIADLDDIQASVPRGLIWHDERSGCSVTGVDYSFIALADADSTAGVQYHIAGASLYQYSAIKFDSWPYAGAQSTGQQNRLYYYLK